jgi:hypothetical protein
MYAIGHIIYGLPLKAADCREADPEWSEELEEAMDDYEDGFHTPYSGSGENPAAFGVQLAMFDEACHHINLTDLVLTPTEEQKAEYARLFAGLTPDLQKELSAKSYGEPRVFILWATS